MIDLVDGMQLTPPATTAGLVGTQAAYARHAGISRQAVNKMVSVGKIPRRPDGLINFVEADVARAGSADPARRLADPPPAGGESDSEIEAAGLGGLSFSKERAKREAYQAELARLEYERQTGAILARAEVADAMVAAGRKIRQGLDHLVGRADELTAVAIDGGAPALRAALKAVVRDMETRIAESLVLMGEGEEQE